MINEAEITEAVKKQNLLYEDPAWNKGWDAAIEVAHSVTQSQRAEIRRLTDQLTRLRTELKRIYDGPREQLEAEFIKLAHVVCEPPFREGR